MHLAEFLPRASTSVYAERCFKAARFWTVWKTKNSLVAIQEKDLIVSKKWPTFHAKCFMYATNWSFCICFCHGFFYRSLMGCSQVLYFDLHVSHESLMQQYRTMLFPPKAHYVPGNRVCPRNAHKRKIMELRNRHMHTTCSAFRSRCAQMSLLLVCIYLFSFVSLFPPSTTTPNHLSEFVLIFFKQLWDVKWTGLK